MVVMESLWEPTMPPVVQNALIFSTITLLIGTISLLLAPRRKRTLTKILFFTLSAIFFISAFVGFQPVLSYLVGLVLSFFGY